MLNCYCQWDWFHILAEAAADEEGDAQTQQSEGEELAEGASTVAIGKQEWLNLKSTVASIQQQMQLFNLQQFQIMQILASQNSNSSQPTTCGNFLSFRIC